MGAVAGPWPTVPRLGSRRLMALLPDDRLVALSRSGNEAAFEAIFDRYRPGLLSFCRHLVGSRADAEDALQHTFLAAYRELTRSDKQIALRPWLYAIARNRCLSLLRARRLSVDVDEAEPATEGLATVVQQRQDLRDLLRDLQALPDDQ